MYSLKILSSYVRQIRHHKLENELYGNGNGTKSKKLQYGIIFYKFMFCIPKYIVRNYFVKSVTKIYFRKIYNETDFYEKTTFELERKSDFRNKLFYRELFAKFFIS